jgi:DNA replication protein DnaC
VSGITCTDLAEMAALKKRKERTIQTEYSKAIQKLASCSFIEQKLNIVISGKTGSGKSYIACAFGNAACRHGYPVKYFRIPELLLEIQDAKVKTVTLNL